MAILVNKENYQKIQLAFIWINNKKISMGHMDHDTPHQLISLGQVDDLDLHIPVSYTHLDVYKRQH